MKPPITLSPLVLRRPALHGRLSAALLLVVGAASVALSRGDTILDSKHNLSATGSGTVKASSETEVCIFCHTPHNAEAQTPLWNHAASAATYKPYRSTTLGAAVGQPTGSSRLCLSCHDGTVALGMVRSRGVAIEMRGGVTTLPTGRGNLGTDLSDDHPVSFTYDSALAGLDGQLRDPQLLSPEVKLDQNRQMQCTSCHDAHNNQFGKFLVKENTGSALCLECHNLKGWLNTAHKLSSKTWNGSGTDPWPNSDRATVAANGCENCHTSHSAGTGARLLNQAQESQNCLTCHSGTVAARNLTPEFNKFSAHPIFAATGTHDPIEDTLNPGTRHVTCVDCHNPHAATAAPATAPTASGALAGVRGISSSGTPLAAVTREYELCFRCHADSFNRGPARLDRQFPQTNTRLEFAASATSFHPVLQAGRNSNVPSLIPPWNTGSLMYCTDCHNNNQSAGAGGTGPNGPHGSTFEPILERNLQLRDGSPEGPGTYALCYKCHDRSKLLFNPTASNEKEVEMHKKHVVERNVACTTCHDSHGVQGAPNLINFNRAYVTPAAGIMQFTDRGTFHGSCTLTCHGTQVHVNKSY